MKLKYFSIDIETTGLNPKEDQILEIGIVYDDLETRLPIEKLPKFHCYIAHERLSGNPYALNLNAKIIERIVNKSPNFIYSLPELTSFYISLWLNDLGFKEEDKITLAGKNVASFDLPFLQELPKWNIKSHHRVIDPTILYLNEEDTVLPNLATCKERAGLENTVAHTAIEDALDVVKLIRNKF